MALAPPGRKLQRASSDGGTMMSSQAALLELPQFSRLDNQQRKSADLSGLQTGHRLSGLHVPHRNSGLHAGHRNSGLLAGHRNSGIHSRAQKSPSMLSEIDSQLQELARSVENRLCPEPSRSSAGLSKSFGSTSDVLSTTPLCVSPQGLIQGQLELQIPDQNKTQDKVHVMSEMMVELASQLSAEHVKQVRHLHGKFKLCDSNRVSLKAEVDKLRNEMTSMKKDHEEVLTRGVLSDSPRNYQGSASMTSQQLSMAPCLSDNRINEASNSSTALAFLQSLSFKIPWKRSSKIQKQQKVSPFDAIVTDLDQNRVLAGSVGYQNRMSVGSVGYLAPPESKTPAQQGSIQPSANSPDTIMADSDEQAAQRPQAGLKAADTTEYAVHRSEQTSAPPHAAKGEVASCENGQETGLVSVSPTKGLVEEPSEPLHQCGQHCSDACRKSIKECATSTRSAEASPAMQRPQGPEDEVPEEEETGEKSEDLMPKDNRSSTKDAKESSSTAGKSKSRSVCFVSDDRDSSMRSSMGLQKLEDQATESAELAAQRRSMVRFAEANDEDVHGSGASEEHCFSILDVWTEKKQESQAAKLLRGAALMGSRHFFDTKSSLTMGDMDSIELDADDSSEDEAENAKNNGICSRKFKCVIPPNSIWRMWWDILAAVLVYYDCIAIPLQFLEIPENSPTIVMTWTTRIFWSMDVPLSCLTGYVAYDGRTVTDFQEVVKHYLRTWFPIDLMMVVIDWAQVLAGGFGGVNAARMTKTLKSMRLVRVMRLWKLHRTKRLPEWMQGIVDIYLSSEVSHIFVGILKIVIFLIWVNHTCACLWYSLAREQDDKPNWLTAHLLMDSEVGYRYATAFHWSLTQFTGAMEVVPHNLTERIFAVCVLLLAFVLAATVVSSITSSMTRFEIATAQESRRLSLLRQYLFHNRINNKLALRVQRNAQYAWLEQKRSTPESQIELLELISDPLRMELHYEINMRFLGVHPFFKEYSIINPHTCKQVCHLAVSALNLSRQDILFDVDEVAQVPRMYFVTKGKLQYQPRHGNIKKVTESNWACEPALWTEWVHCGTLRARVECSLLVLLTEKFQDLANQAQNHIAYPRKYGKAFVRCLNYSNAISLTDLEDPDMELRWLAKRAAEHGHDELGRESTRHTTSIGHVDFNAMPSRDDSFLARASNLPRGFGLLKSSASRMFGGNTFQRSRSDFDGGSSQLNGEYTSDTGEESRTSNISCR